VYDSCAQWYAYTYEKLLQMCVGLDLALVFVHLLCFPFCVFSWFSLDYFVSVLFAFLWPPYLIGQAIIFLLCGFYLLLSSFFSSPNLSGQRSDVYHTSTHGVALV